MEEYLQQITRLMNLNGEAVEGMMVVNKDGIVEYYKPGNPFGKLPEEFGRNVVGNHLLSVYTELSEENSTVMNTLRTGQITVGEKQVLTHEDLQITMVTTTYPILNQQGEIQGAVDIAQILDVRSLKGAAPVSADHSVLDDIVTRNKEMARLKAAIRTIAKNDSATLIYGETGTGKELFAEALHALSGRRDKPFLSQNCAAIPENLLESMFFGTERGGFTGAESKKGLFELADGGTLFLDEINSRPSCSRPWRNRRCGASAAGRTSILMCASCVPPTRTRRPLWNRGGCARTSITASGWCACACPRCGSGRRISCP